MWDHNIGTVAAFRNREVARWAARLESQTGVSTGGPHRSQVPGCLSVFPGTSYLCSESLVVVPVWSPSLSAGILQIGCRLAGPAAEGEPDVDQVLIWRCLPQLTS